MSRIIGTVRRIGALIRRRWRAILRLLLWAALIVLAILSAVGKKGWWPSTTQAKIGGAVLAILVVNIIFDFATGMGRRLGNMGWLLTAAQAGILCASMYFRYGWLPALAIGYLLWRFIPWPTPTTPTPTTPTPPAPTTPTPPTQAAATAASAAPAAPAPSHGTEIGRWYFGTIPIIRLPLLTVRYSLGNGVVYRQVFGRLRDTEVFGNIKNWDITPDDVTARVTGTCTFRILPDKIGEKALEVWAWMPVNFALDLDEALTRAKANK